MTNAEMANALLMDTLEERIDYLMSLIMQRDKDIAKLHADNRSLVEQMNAMALRPNQEIIEWHDYPDEKPERNEWCLVVTTRNSIMSDLYLNGVRGFTEFGNFVLRWAYLPKGVNHD